MSNTTYFFVIDGVKYERQAWMLAVSLRMVHGFDAPVIAYISESKQNQITGVTRNMFDKCQVEIRTFKTSNSDWATPYPVGNKLLAARERRETTHSVFLDSDTVCTGLLDFQPDFDGAYLAAVPEGKASWKRRADRWEPVYKMFGLEVPEERVRLVRFRHIEMVPYFNAGLVAFRKSEDANGMRLPDLWYDTAVQMDHNEAIDNKRPWLDQISLPVAAARMNAKLIVLDQKYNMSLYGKVVDPDIDARLMHYHRVAQFNKWPQCRNIIDTAIQWCPEPKRGHMKRHLSRWNYSGKPAP